MKINLLLGKVLIFFQIFSLSIWASELKTNLRDSKIHSSWASRRVLNYSLRRSVKFSCIFTARKRSLRRLCFYTCVAVHREGAYLGMYPPDQVHPPGPGTPWDQVHPQDQVHPPGPGTLPLGPGTPPGSSACWEIRATSGQYASYWNAFLFRIQNSLFYGRFWVIFQID